eukprot:4769772-Prymnesium_polylepis.1
MHDRHIGHRAPSSNDRHPFATFDFCPSLRLITSSWSRGIAGVVQLGPCPHTIFASAPTSFSTPSRRKNPRLLRIRLLRPERSGVPRGQRGVGSSGSRTLVLDPASHRIRRLAGMPVD